MMELVLNTVRKIDNDQTKEFTFGNTQSLEDNLAIAFLNPKNAKELNITKDGHIKISNEGNSIIIKVIEDENTPEGIVVLPVSIWANQITQVRETEIFYKNIMVHIESTNEPITRYGDIINKIKGD
jgi:formylmethanofuran dehydrogenase subunit D